MDSKYKYLLGEGAYPPLEKFDIYLNEKIGIFMTKEPTELPLGVHIHSSYEFSIPYSLSPVLQLEKNQVILEKNKIFPFNPEQFHGTTGVLKNAHLLAYQIDKDYMNEIAALVYGKTKTCFKPCNSEVNKDLRYITRQFVEESKEKQSGYELIIQSLTMQIIVLLLRTLENNMSCDLLEKNYQEKKHIKKAIEFITENHKMDFSLDDLAKVVNFSPFHLIRIFKGHTGKTPHEYLMDVKINKASILLKNSETSITDIGYSSGFRSSSYFSKVFKSKTGLTPQQYRNMHRF